MSALIDALRQRAHSLALEHAVRRRTVRSVPEHPWHEPQFLWPKFTKGAR